MVMSKTLVSELETVFLPLRPVRKVYIFFKKCFGPCNCLHITCQACSGNIQSLLSEAGMSPHVAEKCGLLLTPQTLTAVGVLYLKRLPFFQLQCFCDSHPECDMSYTNTLP